MDPFTLSGHHHLEVGDHVCAGHAPGHQMPHRSQPHPAPRTPGVSSLVLANQKRVLRALTNRSPASYLVEYVATAGGQLVGARGGHAVDGVSDGDVEVALAGPGV